MEQIETDQVVHNWRDNHNKNAAIMLTFIVMMIAKIITLMLPNKYFYDKNNIMGVALYLMRYICRNHHIDRYYSSSRVKRTFHHYR